MSIIIYILAGSMALLLIAASLYLSLVLFAATMSRFSPSMHLNSKSIWNNGPDGLPSRMCFWGISTRKDPHKYGGYGVGIWRTKQEGKSNDL